MISLNRKPGQPIIVVLAPTKELVEQVAKNTKLFSKYVDSVHILEIFGDISEKKQVK